jgi:hypothetical protein
VGRRGPSIFLGGKALEIARRGGSPPAQQSLERLGGRERPRKARLSRDGRREGQHEAQVMGREPAGHSTHVDTALCPIASASNSALVL